MRRRYEARCELKVCCEKDECERLQRWRFESCVFFLSGGGIFSRHLRGRSTQRAAAASTWNHGAFVSNHFKNQTRFANTRWLSDACEPLLEEWEVWMTQQQETRKKAEGLEQHKAWVEKLLDIAEGRAGMLHNRTKPRPWRGGSQVI